MECYERTCCVIGLGYLDCRNGACQGVLEYIFCSSHLWFLERIFGGRKTNADGGVAMKTPEDEAFEDIERRQGGGFKAKQAMAANKLLEPVECLDCGSNNVGIPATYDSLVNSVKSQPAQESRWYCIDNIGMATLCADEEDAKQNAKLAEREWPLHAPYKAVQLCEYASLAPQPAQEPVAWVGLTDAEIQGIHDTYHKRMGPMEYARAIEQLLKEKNG